MVDRQNLPRPAPENTEDGIPTTWGTTAAEQLASEPLDVRLGREMPEVAAGEISGYGADVADRPFLEPGAPGGLFDDETDAAAELAAGPSDTVSPEEAAMQVVEEPPGLNYDPDPGYVDRQEIG